MYKVLLPVGESRERANRASEVVTNLPRPVEDIEITILNVFEEFEVSDEHGKLGSEDLYDEEDFPDVAIEVHDSLDDHGFTTLLRREHGNPSKQIINVAGEIQADIIVMGGRKRSPVSKAVFGSVTQDVLIEADRPVMVIPVE